MLLKLITVSALSIGLATSAMAQASGGSGGTGGSGSMGSGSASGNNGGSGSSDRFNDGKDAAGGDIRESSDCVQGKTAANKSGKPVPGTAKDAAGNCQ